jgi:uncharacterized protein (DUF1499 family)
MVRKIIHCSRDELFDEIIIAVKEMGFVVILQSFLKVELEVVRVAESQVGLSIFGVNRQTPLVGVNCIIKVTKCDCLMG